MIDFLYKSSLSLFVLLAVYHLVLEKEKMHRFNRFYLLFGIVFSLVIPFITIDIVTELITPIENQNTIRFLEGTSKIIKETNLTSYIVWSLYGVITLLLTIQFIVNLKNILAKVKSNQAIPYKKAQLILLQEKTLPHTFLNWIFVNESDYKNKTIEDELFTHELTHVMQKHTLDILLVELLKTIFWFNPVFIFYKKAIQLNHEFLADENVVRSYNDAPFYQSLLLSKTNVNRPLCLVSNLNFLATKKRLLMMTKSSSHTSIKLKKIIIIPIFVLLFYGISFKTVAMAKPTFQPIQSKNSFIKKEKLKNKKELLQNSDDLNNSPITTNSIASKKQSLDSITPKALSLIETTQPEFPGGILAFYKFIGTNFKIPVELKGSGKVILTFMVEKDGSLSEFKIIKDLGFGTADEIIRVLQTSPKWIPGKENNELVRVLYNLPVQIEPEKNR